MVLINPLTPFPYPTTPLGSGTPLTYREGITVLGLIEALKSWIEETVAPELHAAIELAVTEFTEGLTNAENTIIANKLEWQELFDNFMENIALELLALNDVAVSELVNTPGSQLSIALNNHFASKETQETVESGRLSENGIIDSLNTVPSELAYRKRIVHSLPFKFPDYDTAYLNFGQIYPQSFNVDEVNNELFVNYSSDSHNVIAIFDWATGSYKSHFAMESAYASEGLVIRHEGPSRFLYIRYAFLGLGKFDITATPANGSIRAPIFEIDTNSGSDFCYRDGKWTLVDVAPTIGTRNSRGNFKILDDGFTLKGTFVIPNLMAGGNTTGDYVASTVPKMQGLCDTGNSYVFSMGGFHGAGNVVDPYGYQGVRVFSPNGSTILEALIDPEKMIATLNANGILASRVEGEGAQYINGKVVSFTVVNTYGSSPNNTTNGLLFMEEFSNHSDAIDFSGDSVSWSIPNLKDLQVGLYPRQDDGDLYNAITAEKLTSTHEIILFMIEAELTEFSFYSTSVTILDHNNVAYPSGIKVTISNLNNLSFTVTEKSVRFTKTTRLNPDGVTPGVYTAISSDTGWVDLVLTAGVVKYPGAVDNTPQVRVKDGVCYVRGAIQGVPPAPSAFVVANLPSYAFPERGVFTMASAGATGYTVWSFNSAGTLSIGSTNISGAGSTTFYPLPSNSFPVVIN